MQKKYYIDEYLAFSTLSKSLWNIFFLQGDDENTNENNTAEDVMAMCESVIDDEDMEAIFEILESPDPWSHLSGR